MDQATQTQSTILPQNILSEEQQTQLFANLGLDKLPEEKKKTLMDSMMQTVLNRIAERIAPVLTENDEKVLADLANRPASENAPLGYLATIVPNLDMIATEEIAKLRGEMKEIIDTVNTALPNIKTEQVAE